MSTFAKVSTQWSQEEIDLLTRLAQQKRTFWEIATELDRTEGSVRLKCLALGLKRVPDWTDQEVAFLRAHYPTDMPINDIAKHLKRTRTGVERKAFKLRIKRGKGLRWSVKDLATLNDMYAQGIPSKTIGEQLGRTERAVDHMAWKLGLRKPRVKRPERKFWDKKEKHRPERNYWTVAEDTRLTELWLAGAVAKDIAAALNRSRSAVINRRKLLGLSPRQLRRGVAKDVRQLYRAGYSPAEIAELTGIAQELLENRLQDQETRREPVKPHKLTEDETDTIITHYENGCTVACISERIGRSSGSIYSTIRAYDLRDTPQDIDDTVWELVHSGLTPQQVAWKLELPLLRIEETLARCREARIRERDLTDENPPSESLGR